MDKNQSSSRHRVDRNICLPITQEIHNNIIDDPVKFRNHLDKMIELFPELFPAEISNGYQMKDTYKSKKMSIVTRRIKIDNTSYNIRPSFVMPYKTGMVDDVEKGLFLRKFNVPFWALSYSFGKDPMYWYRMEQSIGRNSIVGTTIRKPEDIPDNLSADEKHTKLSGDKVYVATTVGNSCILGASVSNDAGEKGLTEAYQVFKEEAQELNPTYSPKTVNIDGWQATKKAWCFLFPAVVIICCFLHVFIKIRDRAKKKYQSIFTTVANKLWECYKSESKAKFSQRVRRLLEWCEKNKVPNVITNPIRKLREKIKYYTIFYDFPDAHRTSNMVDRLMQRMDRHLFISQYFHGGLKTAEKSIRGWVLIQNFAPYNPKTIKEHNGFKSPAERLNQFRYHENWLQNLYISASCGGLKPAPQKAL